MNYNTNYMIFILCFLIVISVYYLYNHYNKEKFNLGNSATNIMAGANALNKTVQNVNAQLEQQNKDYFLFGIINNGVKVGIKTQKNPNQYYYTEPPAYGFVIGGYIDNTGFYNIDKYLNKYQTTDGKTWNPVAYDTDYKKYKYIDTKYNLDYYDIKDKKGMDVLTKFLSQNDPIFNDQKILAWNFTKIDMFKNPLPNFLCLNTKDNTFSLIFTNDFNTWNKDLNLMKNGNIQKYFIIDKDKIKETKDNYKNLVNKINNMYDLYNKSKNIDKYKCIDNIKYYCGTRLINPSCFKNKNGSNYDECYKYVIQNDNTYKMNICDKANIIDISKEYISA